VTARDGGNAGFAGAKTGETARARNCSCIPGITAFHGGQMAEMPV